MAESHPVELRIRIVRAYESDDESYPEVAARFDVGEGHGQALVWLQLCMGEARQSVRGPRPDEMGKNLTLLGAIRLTGWVVLATMFQTRTRPGSWTGSRPSRCPSAGAVTSS
jgi:hypothetical protein